MPVVTKAQAPVQVLRVGMGLRSLIPRSKEEEEKGPLPPLWAWEQG